MKDKYQYYVLNKPYQMLTQFTREENKSTLSDLEIPNRDVYPVGRLDFDSEGLLILTNDNYLKHKLTSHNNTHKRTYLVQLDGDINDSAMELLRKGVGISVEGKTYMTKQTIVNKIQEPKNIPDRNPPIRFRKNIPTSWIKISLTEGKNRQVRKMTAKVGFPTLRLIRIQIEDLTLEGLAPSEFRVITKKEIYSKLKLS